MAGETPGTDREAQQETGLGTSAASPAAAREPDEPQGGRADAGAGTGTATTRAGLVRVYAGTGVYVPVVLGFLVAAALVTLVAQNTSEVAVHWLAWSLTVPSGAVMLAAVLAGSLLTVLGGLPLRRRQRWILSELEELRRLRERAGQAQPGDAASQASPPGASTGLAVADDRDL